MAASTNVFEFCPRWILTYKERKSNPKGLCEEINFIDSGFGGFHLTSLNIVKKDQPALDYSHFWGTIYDFWLHTLVIWKNYE